MTLNGTRTIACLLIGLSAAVLAAHPHSPLGVRVNPQDKRELQVLRYGDKETRLLFRSRKEAIAGAVVSPYFSRIAVIESTAPVVEGTTLMALPKNNMVLLEADGEVLQAVDRDVRQLAFSPDGRRVGFLTGTYYDGGVGFEPTGAFILNGDTGAVEPIAGGESAYEIQWANDGIYLKTLDPAGGSGVLRYDPASKTLTDSPNGSFNVSPDGEFYVARPYETVESGECVPKRGEDSCLRLIDRSTDEVVPFFSSDDLGTFETWVGNASHQIVFSKREFEDLSSDASAYGIRRSENFVYDAETTELIDTFECERAGGVAEGFWITSPRAIHCRDKDGERYAWGFDASLDVTGSGGTDIDADPLTPPLTVEPIALPTPKAGQPAADSEWGFSNPLFTWEGLPGADSYSLQILSGLEIVRREDGIEATRWKSDPLAVGEYHWQVTALSGSTLIGAPMEPVRFFIRSAEADFEPPVATAGLRGQQTQAIGGLVGAPEVELDVDVQDPLAGVGSSRVLLNGRELEETGAPSWDPGINSVEVEAEDRAGNASTSSPLNFKIDKTPPEVSWRFVRSAELGAARDGARAASRTKRLHFAEGTRWLVVSDDAGMAWPIVWGQEGISQGEDAKTGRIVETIKSDQPQVFITSPGAWAFAPSVDATKGDTLWVHAVDRDSRIVDNMTVRVRKAGEQYVLEISASDMFGNERIVSLPLQD